MTGALKVGGGILLSRLFGFVRDAAFAYYFGVGPHADVLRTAFRGPNVLQNLLGEQTLSASFIPIYSRFLAAGREEDGGRFAGAVLGLLIVAASALAVLGVLLAEPFVALLAPGYLRDAVDVAVGGQGVDRFSLSVTAVRIMFPMTAVLVLSAWALGVLNSHRRFFLSYSAAVWWNVAIIAALAGAAATLGASADEMVVAACVGALLGAVLQLAVQLPTALRLLKGFRPSLSLATEGVRDALRAFVPLVAARGVVQLSAYLDLLLASTLAVGAVGALGWAQTLYLLPVSLFGMSVAAAELPELARSAELDGAGRQGRRVTAALGQMAFLTVPTAIGYLALGSVLVAAIYRRGNFGLEDNLLVYIVLCGYSVGLLASTWSRLLNNTFYALSDTKTPARIAAVRVVVSAGLGVALMLWLDRIPVTDALRGLPPAARALLGDGGTAKGLYLGAVGLAAAAGVAAWLELGLLRRAIRRAVPELALPWSAAGRMALLSAGSLLPGAAVWWVLAGAPWIVTGAAAVGCYAAAYLSLAMLLRFPEAKQWMRGLRGLRGGQREGGDDSR